MFCFRLGQCPNFGYVRLRVQGAPRRLTAPTTTTYYPIAKLSYYAPPTRGIFSEKKEMKEANPADVSELEFAILRGDRIGDTTRSVQSSVPRRALIVAPVYDDHETVQTPGIRWMPSTIRDAVLMHKTLMDRGYDPANIRILADGFKFNGASDPTRENIMYSLNWLVDGAGPGDYRFFHFSGHGVRTDSEKGKGKEARKVFEGAKPGSGDTERRAFLGKPSGRLLSQTIKSSERVYYNEALVARISGGIHGEPTQGPPFYIYDWELNNVFAGLPKGSNLTVSLNVKGVSRLTNSRDQCVIDSCASGRIFNNAVKLEGAGFRGPESKGAVNSVTQGLRNALDVVTSPFRTTEKIEMQEELPPEERDMDRIQANMFTWAACHQRQDSVNYADLRSGLFTRLWTEALQKDTNRTLRIGELFKDVSAETLTLGDKEKAWQYVQLWTSTANGDPELQKQILQKPVII